MGFFMGLAMPLTNNYKTLNLVGVVQYSVVPEASSFFFFLQVAVVKNILLRYAIYFRSLLRRKQKYKRCFYVCHI